MSVAGPLPLIWQKREIWGPQGVLSGFIAIEIGLGTLSLGKTGQKELEIGAVVTVAKVDRLVKKYEIEDILGGPLESVRDSHGPIYAGARTPPLLHFPPLDGNRALAHLRGQRGKEGINAAGQSRWIGGAGFLGADFCHHLWHD